MAKNKIFKKIIESPAVALDKTIDGSRFFGRLIGKFPGLQKVEKFWKGLGPGLITGAADDDPSGIATYSQVGAKYGFSLGWLSFFTYPLMAVIQEMCARIGLVTGRGLAANIKSHFPRWVLMICVGLMFGANAFNIGADLGAMASATQLLFPTFSFFWLVLGFTLLSLLLEIFVSYKSYSQYLKWMTFALFSYILTAIILKIDPSTLLKSALIPTLQFNKEQLILICGFFGTTISPYLFFWQSSQEVEEDVLAGKLTVKSRQGADSGEVTKMRVDVWFGMFVSNLVSFFIIVACAATLFKHGITNISSAAEAALALKPLGGQLAYLLFTVGIIGTGLLGVPVLAGSASYALSESFGWRFGLYRKLKEAYAFYGVIIISMIIGFALNFLGINPIVALLYAAVVNGIVSPIIMITIVMLSSNKKVMGRHLNGWKTKTVGWIAVAINLLVAIGTIYALFNV